MKLIRMQAMLNVFGYFSPTSVHVGVRDELLPPAIAIGLRSKAFISYEVQAVVIARIAGKSDEEIRTLVRALVAKRAELYGVVSDLLAMPGNSLRDVRVPAIALIDSELDDEAPVVRSKRGNLSEGETQGGAS